VKPYETVPLANALEPHPEHHIATRLADLEREGFPEVMVWRPYESISGQWEAVAEAWDKPIIEGDPVTFADKLAARLAAMKEERP